MPALFRLFVALCTALLLAAPVSAREEIRSFTSDVVMSSDGSVTVSEAIVINAEGNEIRRGIYRDIPVVMVGPDGGKVRPGFEVTGVVRDGRGEPYRVERMGNFQRIWIGDPDVFIARGIHTYRIYYTMTRMARAFDDHDELFWNATGNYWVFPILAAEANITLPDGAVISAVTGYTGPVGSTEQAVASKRLADNQVSFRSSRALGAGEGMSVAVAFDKGVIEFPTGWDALAQQISDLREAILPVLAALLAVAYNALAWLRVGRDPEKGTIIPLFHPPKGLSPALVHYVHKWGFEGSGWKALTAAIFNLGVKGLVTIDNTSKSLRLTATGNQPDEPLPSGERVVFGYLSAHGVTVVGKATGPELQQRREEFVNAIEGENRALWFQNNTAFSVLGFVLAIALLAGLVLVEALDPLWLVASVIIGVLLAIGLSALGKGWRGVSFSWLFGLFWLAIAGFNLFGFALESFSSITINVAAVSAISIVAITIVFGVLMRAPTLQGRKVMDQIDGLKLYIETAEKERMNMAGVPPMTVGRFERLLPYAIALGVEKPWAEHFEAELARHAVHDIEGDYAPHWYHGGGRPGSRAASNMSHAVSSAAASMTAAMVAAQPVSSSSSGFSSGGGGGSSGGGGGGGGGGGW